MKKSLLFTLLFALVVAVGLCTVAFAGASEVPVMHDQYFYGEFVSTDRNDVEGDALVVFGKTVAGATESGIEIRNTAEGMPTYSFKALHADSEGKFGVALYGVEKGVYNVTPYAIVDNAVIYGDLISVKVQMNDIELLYIVDGAGQHLTNTQTTLDKVNIEEAIGGYTGEAYHASLPTATGGASLNGLMHNLAHSEEDNYLAFDVYVVSTSRAAGMPVQPMYVAPGNNILGDPDRIVKAENADGEVTLQANADSTTWGIYAPVGKLTTVYINIADKTAGNVFWFTPAWGADTYEAYFANFRYLSELPSAE